MGLVFQNPTEDLDPEDMPHLFERFWRKDAARADRDHVGVGLPVAKALADALGIQLVAELSTDRLFTSRLLFSSPLRQS